MTALKLRIVQPQDVAPKLPDGRCIRRKFGAVTLLVSALILAIVLHSLDGFRVLVQS